jgi:coenzyme F420-reducing hydrogenase beta subunit
MYKTLGLLGGIAAVLSELYIQRGGVVYGVVYERKQGVFFKRATLSSELEQFKGSKYVQARMSESFSNVKRDLKQGKEVLFFGTPCQIAGLNAYLSGDRDKDSLFAYLCTVDFLCHGAVPESYLKEELNYLEEKFNFQSDRISFRSNEPDKNYYLCIMQQDELKYHKKAEIQRYFYCFLNSISLRESCFHCQYKNTERVGDITLGDFIGIGQKIKFDISKETMMNPSLILVNTAQGEKMLELCRDNVSLWDRDLDEAIAGGPSLRGCNEPNELHTKFRKLYADKGFVKAANQVTFVPMRVDTFKRNCNIVIRKIKRVIIKIRKG